MDSPKGIWLKSSYWHGISMFPLSTVSQSWYSISQFLVRKSRLIHGYISTDYLARWPCVPFESFPFMDLLVDQCDVCAPHNPVHISTRCGPRMWAGRLEWSSGARMGVLTHQELWASEEQRVCVLSLTAQQTAMGFTIPALQLTAKREGHKPRFSPIDC